MPGPPNFLTPPILSILLTEAAERFSYYGFNAVLVLYLHRSLGYDEPTSISLFAYASGSAYLTPVLGAVVADAFLGRFDTILWFGSAYWLGLVILTIGAYLPDDGGEDGGLVAKKVCTVFGLVLVCLGTGGIKPCVSAFGADQVASSPDDSVAQGETVRVDGDTNDVRSFFSYFYFCINVGGVSSILVVPIIRGHFGFGAAFLAPTVFLSAAMVVFVSKRGEYKMHRVGGEDSLYRTFCVLMGLLRERMRWGSGYAPIPSADEIVYQGNTGRCSRQQIEDAEQVLHILPILSLLPIFWMLYDQRGSVWTLQATRMELHGLQPEQLNAMNPILIMIFIPLFERCIYPLLEGRGWKVTHLRRMAAGMLLTALSFAMSGALESTMEAREKAHLPKVHVLWQLPQITILTAAEILLSVTGLEFSYKHSPSGTKALIMSIYLSTISVGDFLGGVLYSGVFREMDRAVAMHVCAMTMLLDFVVFLFVARWWEAVGSSDRRGMDVSATRSNGRSVDRGKSAILSSFSSGDHVNYQGVGPSHRAADSTPTVEMEKLRPIT